MLHLTTSSVTRVADLDTQRHVTSRTYEYFCYAARHQLLAEQGHSIDQLLAGGLRLEPIAGHSAFKNQQMAGAKVDVETQLFPAGDGRMVWRHELFGGGQPACSLVLETRTLDARGQPVDLLPADSADRASLEEARTVLSEPSTFSGSCKYVEVELRTLFSDRDIFGIYPTGSLWRILEEGRWHFSNHRGLTYEKFVELDTSAFFMGGTTRYYRPLQAGAPIRVRAWIESIAKIRAFMRLDVFAEGQSTPAISTREESLIVSLSRARPRKAPPEYLALVADYIEFPDA